MKPTVVLALALSIGWAGSAARAEGVAVDFNRDVRPILSANCFQCHGPDAGTREADLRLDERAGLFGDSGGAGVVTPGEPQASALYARISAADADERMPPADSGKQLTAEQIATIKRWIEQGAAWQGHWAYYPPARPQIPDVERIEGIEDGDSDRFVRNEIDRFVLAQMAAQGLKPSPPADRVTLMRRLSFDLTGLPPAPAEVEAFLADESSDAYERLVDRLLDSPQFGERMAMSWLDQVRFADTNGYHGDNHRDLFLFRDYVIDAFNSNKPFDRFTIEQLAGDLLPEPTREQKIASGYNRLLMTTREGGAQAQEYLAKYSADRVRNTSSVWLGATLGCAECHDHKFDPYTARDFYRFASFFADLQETAVGQQPPTKMPTPEQQRELQTLGRRLAEVQKILDTPTEELAAAQAQWERSAVPWTVWRPLEAESENGATLEIQDDRSILATGKNPAADTYTITFRTNRTKWNDVTAVRLEVLPDKSLPQQGPGRAGNGNFVLRGFELHAEGTPVAWSQATATHSQQDWDVAGAIDGNPASGWAILDQTGKANWAVFETQPGTAGGSDAGDGTGAEEITLTAVFKQNHGGRHTLGRFRLSATTAPRPVTADSLSPEIEPILAIEPAERSDEQKQQLAAYYRSIAPQLEPVRRQLAELKAQRDRLDAAVPTTLISLSGPPRTIRVLPRGNWLDDSGEAVGPGVPEFLPALDAGDRRATRLDLARWLVDPNHPLTARVFVNRLWKQAFGHGIVRSLDDFGSQGDWPSHPRLLDWLALEFIDSGWDVKHMLRLMVTSGTYRQSSHAGAELRRRDPYNTWLARQSRFRLDAEMVRDNALAVSGLLVSKIGGPSVKPYQPAGYWDHLNFPRRTYQHDAGDDQYRRGLYTYWARTFLHPSLLAFDATTREECTVERPRSNTPLQALVLLNDPSYVEAARALAERMVREGGDGIEQRVRFAYRTVLSREPRSEELPLLTELYEQHRAHYAGEIEAASKLLGVGLHPAPAEMDEPELAAWTSLARVILNLHETIMRY